MDGSQGELREAVRQRYAAVALRVLENPATAECCGNVTSTDPVTGSLYSASELTLVPEEAATASLGCGNPLALAQLKRGQTVLDLGSGGGIDVLLAAQRVGPAGKAYGIDMTDEMLALARANAAKLRVSNAEFIKGQIEALPLPDASVDVVISNCVINLSTDKGAVLRETFRVLRPGGRLAVADVVVDGPIPEDLRRRVELWVGCIAGALQRDEYERLLAAAGFQAITIQATRYYDAEDVGDVELSAWLRSRPEYERARLRRAFWSASVRATKPAMSAL
ncbi:MAG: arsenite methyltransferase [Chloroflexi bacterium]|nr:arsenite methyltransferase [Chloroflexota bacterium]